MDHNLVELADQTSDLKSMGLVIEDEEDAKAFLGRNHYYRLRGYLAPIMDQGKFVEEATFANIKEPYLYDHGLRNSLLLQLETVEISLKTVYCREFCKVHGPTDYLDAAFFTNEQKHQEVMDKADKQRAKRAKNDPTFRYFFKDGTPRDLPIWTFVELLTIKDITDLYIYSEPRIKKSIALSLGFPRSAHVTLGRIMRGLVFLRNQCAHGSRLYNLSFPQKAYLFKKDEALLIKRADGTPDNSHLFGYFIVLKKLLTNEEFQNLKGSVLDLSSKYPSVDLKYYGFPSNWKDAV